MQKRVLVCDLRKHLWDREDADYESDDSTLYTSVFETRPATLGSSTTTTAVSSHVLLQNTQRNLTMPLLPLIPWFPTALQLFQL